MVAIVQPLAVRGSELVDDETGTSVFQFDATVAENHEYSAEVTRHPVERGIDISDNVEIEPFKLTITGIVTNTPIDPVSIVRQNTGLQGESRVRDVWDAITEFFATKRVISVVTGLKVYDNMVISAVRTPRGEPRQDIRPTIELEEIRFADTVLVPIPPDILRADVADSGQSKNDLGQQSATEASEEEKRLLAISKRSVAKNLKEGESLSDIVRGRVLKDF